MSYNQTKIFLDSADARETKIVLDTLGYLNGQTTNPSLIAKVLGEGQKISESKMLEFYQKQIQNIQKLLPYGSISVEVYADETTSVQDIYYQAVKMNGWAENVHVKFPTIPNALEAAEKFISEGGQANFTLIFTQQQAVAIHALAVKAGAEKGQIFISPFVGRLDDIGQNGLNLVQNILTMYQNLHSPVEVLAASLRNLSHLKACLDMPVDIVTLPSQLIADWLKQGLDLNNIVPVDNNLTPIEYQEMEISKNWRDYDISHPLTTKGLAKFAEDWKKNIA